MLLQKMGIFVTMLILMLAVPSFSKADAVSEARKAIQNAYNHTAVAASKLDVKAMYASHSPNFLYEYGRTKEPLHTRIERDAVNFRHIHSTKQKYVIKKLQLKGNVATVLCAVHDDVVFANPDTHKPMVPERIDETRQDTWGKGNKGWLLTATKILN